MFEELGPNLEKYNKHFDKNDKNDSEDVKHTQGEKFNINEDHDFKEWERYDVIHCKKDKKGQGTIDSKAFPNYIKNDLTMGSQQQIEFNMISQIKSG